MMRFFLKYLVAKNRVSQQLKLVAFSLAVYSLTTFMAIAQPRALHIAADLDADIRTSTTSQFLTLADVGLCSSPAIFTQTMTLVNAAPSQDFEPGKNEFDVEVAEDFALPIASALSSISVIGMGATAPDSFLVRIYTSAGSLPGTLLYSELFVDPTYSVSPVFDLSACPVLTSGRYWISVQAVANYGT
ncbi:MAG: hypothetical protein IPL46_21410 [Saprospiraceae bacterium]|nr:hypothetical protein [Saprospiraceae bacterium]